MLLPSIHTNHKQNMPRKKTLPSEIIKNCPTCKQDFSISYYLRNKRTFCSKKCMVNNPSIIDRQNINRSKTNFEKYGGHPMTTERTKEVFKKSMLKKYGVEWPSKNSEWEKKVKQTKQERYGNEKYNNIEKIKKTCIEKYGADSYLKSDYFQFHKKEICLKKYGVDHPSKRTQFKIHHYKNTIDKLMTHPRFSNFKPLFEFSEYVGVNNQQYKFECIRCGDIKYHSIDNGKSPICPTCDKINSSYFQKEIFDFINGLFDGKENIENNNRKILYPKEIDIVIPSKNIGIECDGLVWHSELIGKKNKIYHLNKTKAAIGRGIRLIHIFENEWNTKKDIVKSILSTLLKKNTIKIHARKCHVKEIDGSSCAKFIDDNHIQGRDVCNVKLGLFYNEELVSVMTFSKPKFDKSVEWELSRFCNKINTIIHGGASKLFTHFIKNYNPKSIISYSDKRYFDGMLYLNLGFSFSKTTPPSYYYIIDNYQTLQNRISWQKHKLKNKLPKFDPSLSEWENMKNNGFDRIWDCGCIKWRWESKSVI